MHNTDWGTQLCLTFFQEKVDALNLEFLSKAKHISNELANQNLRQIGQGVYEL